MRVRAELTGHFVQNQPRISKHGYVNIKLSAYIRVLQPQYGKGPPNDSQQQVWRAGGGILWGAGVARSDGTN